jgi:signal transduction histidine kinase
MTQPSAAVSPAEPARRHTLAEQELIQSLGWLVVMRWFAGLAVLVAAFVAAEVLRLPVPAPALYAMGLITLGYNAAFALRLRRLQREMPESMIAYERFTREQIGADWLAMTILVALSGGVDSPAIIFFLFHISIAALLLPHTRGFLYVAVAPALVSLVALVNYFELVPHVSPFDTTHYQDPAYVASVLFFFTSGCYVMAYFCASIARRLRRRENEISGLFESVRDTTSTLDLQTVLNRFVEAATRVLDCKGAAIRLLDASRTQVAFAATYGLSDEYLRKVPVEYGRARLDQETLAGDALFVNDAQEDPRVLQPEGLKREGIVSMLSVPLVGKGGPLGVLRAYGAEGHRFTDEDASFLELVAAHGAVAIENAQAYQMLADLNQEKSKFVRVTTHELRAPAQVTESLLTALATGYAGQLTSGQSELVNRALRRLRLLQGLVDDLLDLAAGKVNLRAAERRAVTLQPIVADVCSRFESRAREKGLALEVDLPPAALQIWCDPADMDRILTNLVSNGVKYTTAGKVSVRLEAQAGKAELVVADTGIGIAASALPHVFEEFYRAPNAKAMEEAGTGLGLAIVKDLAERYGGQIQVDSQEGKGTTFTIRLPLIPTPAGQVVASG